MTQCVFWNPAFTLVSGACANGIELGSYKTDSHRSRKLRSHLTRLEYLRVFEGEMVAAEGCRRTSLNAQASKRCFTLWSLAKV